MLTFILFPTDWQLKLNSISKQEGAEMQAIALRQGGSLLADEAPCSSPMGSGLRATGLVGPLSAKVVISAHRTTTTSTCPDCHKCAHRVHGHYPRNPIDLPICGISVQLTLTVRRFCCDNRRCRRTTFAESLEAILPRYARRTHRLAFVQQQVAFELGGRAGARLLAQMAMDTSRDTLIRMIRSAVCSNDSTPRVLGVDDWAFKKGQSYGTLLVDLETHQVVDLLPDRKAKSLAKWLAEHPGVEIISRDRGKEYIKGATDGAPKAIQVADRWHLLKNLREALERVFEAKPDCLLSAANPMPSESEQPNGVDGQTPMAIGNESSKDGLSPEPPSNSGSQRVAEPLTQGSSDRNQTATIPGDHDDSIGHGQDLQSHTQNVSKSTAAKADVAVLNRKPPTSECQLTACQGLSQATEVECSDTQQTDTQSMVTEKTQMADDGNPEKQTHKLKRFVAVKHLQKQGLSQREIARRLNMNRRTVSKYISAVSCPTYRLSIRRARLIDQYQSHIINRLKQGCTNATVIFSQLQQQGFSGSYGTVARFVSEAKAAGSHSTHRPKLKKPWSPARVAWLLVKQEVELTDDEKNTLLQIKTVDLTVEVAHTLGQRFCDMIRHAEPKALMPWLEDVAQSSIPALKNFAKGIKADLSAVTNALGLPWSQGQTEGQVNRLKLIKRAMYGRANFDLLRKRVIGLTVHC